MVSFISGLESGCELGEIAFFISHTCLYYSCPPFGEFFKKRDRKLGVEFVHIRQVDNLPKLREIVQTDIPINKVAVFFFNHLKLRELRAIAIKTI